MGGTVAQPGKPGRNEKDQRRRAQQRRQGPRGRRRPCRNMGGDGGVQRGRPLGQPQESQPARRGKLGQIGGAQGGKMLVARQVGLAIGVVARVVAGPRFRIRRRRTDARGGVLHVAGLDNGYAPFVSYSTSFEPQLGITADGNPQKPSKGRMLEAGVRYLRPDNSFAFSATVFAGKNDRFAVSDTVNTDECAAVTGSATSCQNDDDTKEARGLELEAKAQLDDGLDVIAGLTWQHVRLTESQGADADLHLVAVPKVTASVWVNYQSPEGKPLHGWTLGGGLRHIGATYATDSNLWGASEGAYAGQKSKVPSFTLVDAAVGYDFGVLRPDLAGLRADLRVLNLFDRDYVAACNGYGSCSFGEGHTARLSLNYRW